MKSKTKLGTHQVRVIALASIFLMSGCATEAEFIQKNKAKAYDAAVQIKSPVKLQQIPSVQEHATAYLPVTYREAVSNSWLKQKRVNLRVAAPIPLSEALGALSRQGIGIITEVPVDSYAYFGFSLTDVDAETALKLILGSTGLDFSVNADKQIVSITPLKAKTWYLNMGNRKSSFSSASSGGLASVSSGASAAASSSSGTATTGTSSGGSASTEGQAGITVQDDFWGSLRNELDSRLKVMVPDFRSAPVTQVAAMPQPVNMDMSMGAMPIAIAPPQNMQSSAPTTGNPIAYTLKQVGTYSINPETGSVTVQAPHWVLDELETYFKKIQEMYNTDITFTGEMVELTVDDTHTEGLDISGFAKFASDKLGLAVSNNALGGVTVSFPSGTDVPRIATGNQTVSNAMLGLQHNSLQIFNAFLANMGNVDVLQKPVVSTTSGVPGDFRRTVTRYYNTVTQQAASGGTGSAAVGTQNTLVPIELGTVLRINPRMDTATNLIRAQIVLEQTTQSGIQSVQQALTSGDTVQQLTTQIPILTKISYAGEVLLKDGDMVILGGQTDDSNSFSKDGITGLMDTPLAVIAANKTFKKSRSVFYFALKVTTTKRK